MTTTVEAIYEDGVLKLLRKLPLAEKTHVKVIIESGSAANDDSERAAWLKLSEEALTKSWDNAADDVFNDLLKR